MEIIELDTIQTVKKHGNLYHTARVFLRRQFGHYTTIFTGPDCGTIRDHEGRSWDYWYDAVRKKWIIQQAK